MAGKLKNIIPHLQRGLNTKQIMIYKSKIKQKKKKSKVILLLKNMTLCNIFNVSLVHSKQDIFHIL